jgi:hypothetical protein
MAHKAYHERDPIDVLRRVPFVQDLRYTPGRNGSDQGYDGEIELITPAGPFRLVAETKRSFLTRSTVNQFLAWVQHLRTGRSTRIILLARHIPRQVAERLIGANVNFADDAGNVHLELGDRYNWTVVGNPAVGLPSERRRISPAQIQLLFQFVTHPESVSWPVRRLESAAGISKSKAAQARHELIAQGLLVRKGKQYQLGSTSLLSERLVSGYAHVLRPKLLLGTYRAAEKTAESFLSRLRREAPPGIRYALSGGPAADLLQHYYRGPEVPLFLQPLSGTTAHELRLLPDSNGPVSLLHAFGELVFWQEREDHMLAPPWLIYAELLTSSDPRAHEAAAEFHGQFLR